MQSAYFFHPLYNHFPYTVQEIAMKYFLFLHSNPPEKSPPMLVLKRSQTHVRTNQTHRPGITQTTRQREKNYRL